MEICRLPPSFSVTEGHLRLKSPAKSFSCSATFTGSISGGYEIESERRNRMFILGMGYVAQFFGQDLKKEGWSVTGTCTSTVKKKELESRGFDICLFDANDPQPSALGSLRSSTHLLVSIPSSIGIGDPVLQHEELLRSTIMDGNLQWLCYLSSTSVYGDSGGAWVNEDYPANPMNESAKSRLAAEEGWLNWGDSLGIPTQIFRLGGIYGPGRSAVDTIIKQEALSKSQKRRISRQYTSRIHVEDICQALKASIKKPSFRRIYNVVDDDPASREQVFAYAEELVEKKWSGWVKKSASSERVLAYEKDSSRDEKRVRNGRMKRELGVELIYRSYRSGLLSIIDQMNYNGT
ncbi:NAD(P)-binding Rossmann-fold superfamily protein [Euphorbia peplus]|nr:NAD(P)-binding Rossmann-fold superfamily protein [Euphorbia peplus]